jgi:hypothetical protein
VHFLEKFNVLYLFYIDVHKLQNFDSKMQRRKMQMLVTGISTKNKSKALIGKEI